MTLEELKEKVRQLIGHAKAGEAINRIINWANANDLEQLKTDSNQLKGNLASLERKFRLGMLSNSEATMEQNKINYGVLELLNTIEDNNSAPIEQTILSSSRQLKILMLSSNPAGMEELNLNAEHSAILEKLQEKQELFKFKRKKAVSAAEFKEFTEDEEPNILHFSGHGTGGIYSGIMVQNAAKNDAVLIPTSGLDILFEYLKKQFTIDAVILNACFTRDQAATIAQHVEYVIGTTVAIGDDAAKAFSQGFYYKIGRSNQLDIERAFDSGRVQASMSNAAKEHYIIYRNGEEISI